MEEEQAKSLKGFWTLSDRIFMITIKRYAHTEDILRIGWLPIAERR